MNRGGKSRNKHRNGIRQRINTFVFRHASILLYLFALPSVLLTGCSGGSAGGSSSAPAPTVKSIAVAGTTSLIAGQSQQLSATAEYSDGSTVVVTSSAAWSSSNSGVATVVSNSGYFTGVAAGSSTISASFSGISGSAPVTVIARAVTSIELSPPTATLAIGVAQQLLATGIYNDGSTGDLTHTATWSSSSPASATVSATGVVTPLAQGAATIMAASGSVSGSASITVPNATGGLIANLNLTDPLLMYGTEANGTVDSFFGLRDSNGIPLSFYSITSQSTDGTVRTVQLDSQQRVIQATNSQGIDYNIQWLSNTAGVINVETTTGTTYSASAYFNLGTTSSAADRAKSQALTSQPSLASPDTAAPSTTSILITAESGCSTPPTPEPGASVYVTGKDSAGHVFELQPQDNNNGTFTVTLPSSGSAANTGQSNSSLSTLLNAYCSGTVYATYICPVLQSWLDKLDLPAGSDLNLDCSVSTSPAKGVCAAGSSIYSSINRFTQTPTLTEIEATASLDSQTSAPQSQEGQMSSNGLTFLPMTLTLPCELPKTFEVFPNAGSTIGSPISIGIGQSQALQGQLLDQYSRPITSAAYSISWAAPGTSNGTYFNVAPVTTPPGGSVVVTGVSPTVALPLTATVTGANFLSPVTVQIEVSDAVVVTPATVSVPVGQTTQLSGQVLNPSGNPVSGISLSWSSSNSSIASVNPTSGLVTGESPGITTIFATDPVGAQGSAQVTVSPGAPNNIYMMFGFYINATAYPSVTVNGQPINYIPTAAMQGTYNPPGDSYAGPVFGVCNVPNGTNFTVYWAIPNATNTSMYGTAPALVQLQLINANAYPPAVLYYFDIRDTEPAAYDLPLGASGSFTLNSDSATSTYWGAPFVSSGCTTVPGLSE